MSIENPKNLEVWRNEQKGGDILSILSNIGDLLKEQGKTQKELCDYLGYSTQTYTAWKAGQNESYKKHIPNIAKFFGVPISRIYGEGGTPKMYALNKKLEKLTPEQLKFVEEFIESYIKHNENK